MVAYHFGDIYLATAVLMVAMVLLAVLDYLWYRRVTPMHALSTALVLVFGAATLIFHDARFLKWKPTILMWLMAAAFLGSQWIGKTPLVQRFLEPALNPGTVIPRARWLRVNGVWVGTYLVLGMVNLLVARHATEQTWVYFKGFGLSIALAVLAVGQALWLQKQKETP